MYASIPKLQRSPRRHRRRWLAALVVGVGLFVGSACAPSAPTSKDLSAAMVDSGLSRKVADCVASALTKSLSSAELAEITERGAGGAPVDDPKITGDNADELATAMAVCRDLQVAAQPTTTTTTTPTTPTTPTTTGVDQGVGG